MSAIIRFDNVSVCVRDKKILSNVSFTLNFGEKAVLCGLSGSGKSTVLKAILGLQSVSHGIIYFQQVPINSANISEIRNQTAYIGQEPLLAADNVRDALLLPFQFKSHRDKTPSNEQIQKILTQLNLNPDILNQQSNSLSGGEKQRIALARGFLLGKKIFLLDEVTSALDRDNKLALYNMLDNPELTILSVAHDRDWIDRCQSVLELESGQLTRISQLDYN